MDIRPKKTVRFASIPPRTPSPASSTAVARYAELPPWEPVSPPHYAPHKSPATSSPLADGPSVDALLEVLPFPGLPPLLWDVAAHPEHIRLGSAYSPDTRTLSAADVAHCAVRSSAKDSRLPLRKVVLLLPTIPLEIEITPASDPLWAAEPLPYVTVGDVAHGLYRALRVSVKPDEVERLDARRRDHIRRAFEKRVREDPANRGRNVQFGIRRVDYLEDRRAFLGIRPAHGPEVPARHKRSEVFVVELGRVS
ncbi:hypothetical protein GY45DRAFT_1345746 [Cubamyces sp. BRFM 1775]|nr:hypothetical protein GY45DRAFT_1345746 [Cubamyces sp. BRFM 1775]